MIQQSGVLLLILIHSEPLLAHGLIHTSVNADGVVTISNIPQKKITATVSHEEVATYAYIYEYLDAHGNYLLTDKPSKQFKLIRQTKVKVHPMPKFFHPVKGVDKSRFNELIEQTAARHQVDAKLIHAMVQTESAYNENAVSPAGAVGLMQLMPDTAKRFGVSNRQTPEDNLEGGVRYMRYLLDLFPDNLDLAVAAYNAGENAVIRHNNAIPPYPETMNYVRQVLALYNQTNLP